MVDGCLPVVRSWSSAYKTETGNRRRRSLAAVV